MIERITKNEERLDNILSSIKELEKALSNSKNNKKDISLLNKYYGNKNWFKDKDYYENNRIHKIKARVLSEDTVWNMNEDIKDLILEMESIIKEYKGNKYV